MNSVQILAIQAGATDENLVILARKEGLDAVAALLEPWEHAFLLNGAAREVNNFTFPRATGIVFIRLLKTETDPNKALEDTRIAGNELLRDLRQYKIDRITILDRCADQPGLAFAEGLALGSYQFLKYFTNPEEKDKPLREIRIDSKGCSPEAIDELNSIIETVFLARDLVNEPFSYLTAPKLAELAQEAADRYGFDLEVLGKEKIEALKMGGLLAVNKASETPPQFLILEWKPAEPARNAKPVVLVGKGVVYDTGGLSIKPSEGMESMKCDMAGAAAVIATISAAAKNKLPVHLIGLIPATDNLVGEHAIAPGDVIRMYSGKTVEVLNTDAEGRLILADALHYAHKYDPELVIDLATLTGAAVRALGSQAICYMGTASKATRTALEDSGWSTYERLVEFPLWKEYGEELKSNIADVKNIGTGIAGMITAGKFLEHFVSEYPWLHLDIAGPAYLRTANGYRPKDGTGVGVRLLYHFLKKQYTL